MSEDWSKMAWEKIKRLKTENQALMEALEAVEWFVIGLYESFIACRVCGNSKHAGHKSTCKIGNALKLVRGE